jgi:hypothetical protein
MIIRCPSIKGMIEHHDGDQIPAFLLRSSHSGRKFIAGRRHLRRQYVSQVFALSKWTFEI